MWSDFLDRCDLSSSHQACQKHCSHSSHSLLVVDSTLWILITFHLSHSGFILCYHVYAHVSGWPDTHICTVYDRMYGDFPARNTACTPYLPINVWFWPTLLMCLRFSTHWHPRSSHLCSASRSLPHSNQSRYFSYHSTLLFRFVFVNLSPVGHSPPTCMLRWSDQGWSDAACCCSSQTKHHRGGQATWCMSPRSHTAGSSTSARAIWLKIRGMRGVR
jgi:hypothetical protein